MRQSNMFIPTLRDIPQEAVSKSHQLMLKSGMIKQMAAGIYTYLPITKRVLNNIEKIVREEMENIGGAEIHMPVLQPKEIWEESGRWQKYGKELMRIKDRHERDFSLGPTHEEIIVALLRDELKSYKKLPITLFQIQTKFRDELRPRFGLLRGREFIMKDAYSFHTDEESLEKTYNEMYQAYTNIFSRVDLKFRPVEADTGQIGGSKSHEFMALSDIGEDIIVYSDETDYAANIEKAKCVQPVVSQEELKDLSKIETPGVNSCESLAQFLNVEIKETTKTLIVRAGEKFVMFLIRGDRELNDVKAKAVLGVPEIEFIDKNEVESIMNAKPGSLGPVNTDLEVYVDYEVAAMKNFPTGANINEVHYKNVNIDRDFTPTKIGDYRFITEGESLIDGSKARFMKGIEVGQVFQLGTVYSEPMNLNVLNENGRSVPVIMGCYGIGISRTLSAIVESHHDDKGIIWPKSVTPFDVHLVTANTKDKEIVNIAESLYSTLKENFSVLYDDRNERAGVKFNDSDLIGIPVRVVVGRGVKDNQVEVKLRKENESVDVNLDELTTYIKDIY